STDPRFEQIFNSVRREAFMPPGPWKVLVGNDYIDTLSNDPRYLYQNNLIALDAQKGINNGEPFLHARWIGAVAPKAGETVTHIGAGTGYYSAILSLVGLPNGVETAYEVDEKLAQDAQRNLARLEKITVVVGNGFVAYTPIRYCLRERGRCRSTGAMHRCTAPGGAYDLALASDSQNRSGGARHPYSIGFCV